ncbi:sodium/sulfate symporter family transporter [Halosimplex carlsbadense 2-9-1]|uniref:Sodium/sulfate symporter family transporter n=1 Tax=Halosimplex carlsbadense 2-9-1 TaxID=797114 RepID=M0D1W0_9EURY|nr:SLC13 family permease [Halosimplex carlsbadense]ELZ28848.1 sodium/sulfate symporter family transporter [Halosimplex carlsbadense 2-9-1]
MPFGISAGAAFVFLVILAALILFATEPVPVDITALGVLVALLLVEPLSATAADLGLLAEPLVVLSDPAEGLSVTDNGLSGFASSATLTVLAMFILSEGVQRTGVVQILGSKIASFTRDSESRQLGAIIGVVSPISGFINNTAAVAILLPMVTDLAHEGKTSPSKLLLPLSYASMFGGMLTLIGTSTNILASELSGRLIGRTFTMFEFTQLGVVVSIVGTIYLLTVGRWLTPERIPVAEDLTEEFELGEYLTEVVVREDSPMVGETVRGALADTEFDVDLVQLIRGDRTFTEPLDPKTIRAGDVFAVRTDRDTLVALSDAEGLDLLPEVDVDEAELEQANERENLVEVVIAPGSSLVGESLASANFRQRYDATVLALRRGQELFRQRMDDVRLRVGDTLLIQGPPDSIERLNANRDFIVAQEIDRPDYRRSKIPVAIAIVGAVVGAAAVGVLPIVVAALTGALLMVLTGCLKSTEVYDAVQWDVIFLLAGVIPLGIALENTGGADLIADLVVGSATFLPPLGVLALMYLVTALLTNIISNNASVVLMIPVAVEAARQLGVDTFSFILAVTFAASTAFMTPVGYQTNLFVYGPGGYRFSDYLRVGTPLQLIFAAVTTLGIYAFWGL